MLKALFLILTDFRQLSILQEHARLKFVGSFVMSFNWAIYFLFRQLSGVLNNMQRDCYFFKLMFINLPVEQFL